MASIRSVIAWAAAAGVLLTIGCEHNTSRAAVAGTAPPYGVTNEQNAAIEPVVDQLTHARCAREERCNNIGKGRKYVNYDVCVDKERGSAANDLNAYNCPHGIDRKGLNDCVQSLQAGDCSISLNRLQQQVNCRASAMCMK